MPWRFIYMYSWRPYLLGGWRWFTGGGELSHPNFASCSLDPRHPHQYEHSHLHHHHNNVHRHRIWSLLSSLLDWLSIQLSPWWPRLFHQICNDHYSLLSLWFFFKSAVCTYQSTWSFLHTLLLQTKITKMKKPLCCVNFTFNLNRDYKHKNNQQLQHKERQQYLRMLSASAIL